MVAPNMSHREDGAWKNPQVDALNRTDAILSSTGQSPAPVTSGDYDDTFGPAPLTPTGEAIEALDRVNASLGQLADTYGSHVSDLELRKFAIEQAGYNVLHNGGELILVAEKVYEFLTTPELQTLNAMEPGDVVTLASGRKIKMFL